MCLFKFKYSRLDSENNNTRKQNKQLPEGGTEKKDGNNVK